MTSESDPRLTAALRDVAGLKTRISALREEKMAAIKAGGKGDLASTPRPPSLRVDFKPRRIMRGHLGKVGVVRVSFFVGSLSFVSALAAHVCSLRMVHTLVCAF